MSDKPRVVEERKKDLEEREPPSEEEYDFLEVSGKRKDE